MISSVLALFPFFCSLCVYFSLFFSFGFLRWKLRLLLILDSCPSEFLSCRSFICNPVRILKICQCSGGENSLIISKSLWVCGFHKWMWRFKNLFTIPSPDCNVPDLFSWSSVLYYLFIYSLDEIRKARTGVKLTFSNWFSELPSFELFSPRC